MSKPRNYIYGDLTWPELDHAADQRRVILLPVGSTEQHGPHLPLDVDNLIVTRLCLEVGRRIPEKCLVVPTIPYGYNIHGLDYPGTVHVGYECFIQYCVSVCKSLAYHGFKRIVIVNGHGGNNAALELVGRRTTLETDALVASFMWWNLLRIDPAFISSFRESCFPGGAGHACEVETSVYLYLEGEKVQMSKAKDYIAWYNREELRSPFHWGDAFGSGPVSLVEWTSTYSEDGTSGQPSLASFEKGEKIFLEAANRLTQFVQMFEAHPSKARVDHHSTPPSSPLPDV